MVLLTISLGGKSFPVHIFKYLPSHEAISHCSRRAKKLVHDVGKQLQILKLKAEKEKPRIALQISCK